MNTITRRFPAASALFFLSAPMGFWLGVTVSLFTQPIDAQTDIGQPWAWQWGRFETAFTSTENYYDWVRDVRLEVDFISPSGVRHTVPAFWDGDRVWRVRFSPNETGPWRYLTRCNPVGNSGLHARTGSFECLPYQGVNPLYRHGPIRLSPDRRHFIHADGTPFFWMADTAWNGPLLADLRDWQVYLQDRARKKFSAIQFVTTQWRGAQGDALGRPAFTGRILIQMQPEFFQRLDGFIDAVNDHGLLAAPVLLWAVGGDENPGNYLSEDQQIELAHYIVSRYASHHVAWFLGGDGKYLGERSEPWKRVGRAVFGDTPPWPATMHPSFYEWVADAFCGEPWYTFIGYQSSHGVSPERIRWLTEGPPRRDWSRCNLPVINLEPNYEDAKAYETKERFDDHAVRRAAYWSLLVSPPAGVSYGAQGIWGWEEREEEPLNHKTSGAGKPWREAMRFPGSLQMKYMKDLFDSFAWWTLRPAQELIVEQPGDGDPSRFIAAAWSEPNHFALFYTPAGGVLAIDARTLPRPLLACWYNPRIGQWLEGGKVTDEFIRLKTPTSQDWVLLLTDASTVSSLH